MFSLHRFALLMLLSVPVLAFSNPWFEKANRMYADGQYEEAITLYKKMLESGAETPAVCYNLANACYKAGKTGESILYYERCLKLNPADEDAIHNLALARARTVDRLPEVPELWLVRWWNGLMAWLSVKTWLLMAAAMIWIALIWAVLRMFVSPTPWFTALSITSLLISFLFLYLGFQLNKKQLCNEQGVLLADNTYVKSAPDSGSTDLFIIHEGLKFSVNDRVGAWCKIRLADGKTGWVKREVLGII